MTKIVIAGMLLAFYAALAFAAPNQSGGFIVCNQPYAICTTATCIPAPGIKGKAICFCNVAQGNSLGSAACAKRKPSMDNYGQQHLTSSYSFANMEVTRAMTCDKGKGWTFCLDKPCLVDPRNANQAVCTCDIFHSTPYITMGGECNKASCSNTLFSGATLEQVKNGTAILMKATGQTTSPVKFCP
jgi:hypothetical protein